MTATNYVDLDINKLFEVHTIREIEEIRKTIQLESDRKKVELRTLVGERYRDLILAADMIGKMRLTSEQVVSHVADIESEFSNLGRNYVAGFKRQQHVHDRGDSPEDVDSIVIQIKILMDIPEHIWSSIGRGDLLFAAQVYLVAQHLNYSLSFEVGDQCLSEMYSIIGKQWDVISQFRSIILHECDKTLRSIDVQPENAANSLAALVLLNGTTFAELLEKLISLRSRAIESVVCDENDDDVKSKVKQCIRFLVQTVELIYQCFVSHKTNSSGLVIRYVKAIHDQEAFTLLSHLENFEGDEPTSAFLPSVTKRYKPFAREALDCFTSEQLRSNLKSWLSWVGEFCERELTKLLEFVISVKGLYYVREQAVSIRLSEDWYAAWEELSLHTTSFWIEYFQPIITKRAKSIIEQRWSESLETLRSEIIQLLERLSYEKCELPEHDLRWFVWRDSPSDIPQKLISNTVNENVIPNGNSDDNSGSNRNVANSRKNSFTTTGSASLDRKRSLLMKAKGYSPNILALCETFDRNLASLLADLEQYLYHTERITSVKENLLSTGIYLITDVFSDRAELQEYLQTISEREIERLICFVREKCVGEGSRYGNRQVNMIVMARFLLALTTLSPSLNKCFILSKPSGLTITGAKWQLICERLKEESTAVWLMWANVYKTRVREHREKWIERQIVDDFRIRSIVSEWEKVLIEEDSGDGKRIESEILVPYQPSTQLQNFLTAVNKDLNKVLPHTLPKRALHEVVEHAVSELLTYYSMISDESTLSQKQAFQVLFDIKYSTLLMVARENKPLCDRSTKACDNIIRRIDPFDYDAFEPFIRVNVKKSVQRSLLIFGNLVTNLEQLHSILGARGEYATELGSSSRQADPPMMLALCSGAPWLPALTVTTPAKTLPLVSVTLSDKNQRKRSKDGKEGTTGKAEHSSGVANPIKSGAAAFFGAMGSDWFGGS